MGKGFAEYVHFSEKLRQIRIQKGYKTKKEFAKAAGLAYTTYSNYENGSRVPNQKNLELIVQTLGVKMDDFFSPFDFDEYIEHMFNKHNIQNNDSQKTESNAGYSLQHLMTPDAIALLTIFNELNDAGKKAAMERLQELRYVPSYQKELIHGQEEQKN